MPGRLKPSAIWIGLCGGLLGSAGTDLIDALKAGHPLGAWIAGGLSVLALVLWVGAVSAYEKAFETWVKRGKP